MGLSERSEVREVVAPDPAPLVAILEDDPMLAGLAADLCIELGLRPVSHGSSGDFLDAVRITPPAVVVLDWRLQDQLGAAAFMAFRHHYRELPVVCWTASPAWRLPQMILADPMTCVVDKASGLIGLQSALGGALALDEFQPLPGGAADVRPVSHPQ